MSDEVMFQGRGSRARRAHRARGLVEPLETRLLCAASRLAAAVPAAPTFTNPVINSDFPDPGAMQVGNVYYAFATNSGGTNVQEERSSDLVHWSALPDALPQLPVWARAGRTWGPDASLMGNGQYDLYYSAWSQATGHEAVGVAVSSTPAGPYAPIGTAPLVAQFDMGGAIDPSVFTSSTGVRYLLWKNDGNAIGQDTWIWIAPLSSDGLSLVGSPTKLIKDDQTWEGGVIEAPTLWQHADQYYLFYSANYYGDGSYTTGYAESDTLLGGYTKPAGPLLQTGNGIIGPGGPTIVIGPDGNTWMLFHSWSSDFSYRALDIARVEWTNGVPVVNATLAPQLVPQHSSVVGRYAFYNNSVFDGNNAAVNLPDMNAIAPDKQALLPGQVASYSNITDYAKGLNGVMIDVTNLSVTPRAADFRFRAGTDPNPLNWSDAPAPASVTVLPGEGVNGSTRVEIVWADGVIANQWLQVTMLADENTALAAPDVFYFGNLAGLTGTAPPAGNRFQLTAADVAAIQNDETSGSPPTIRDPDDVNRDGSVNGLDVQVARAALGNALPVLNLTSNAIDVPTAAAATITLRRNADGTHDDVWLNAPESSSPTQEALLSQPIEIDGGGPADALVLDMTHGNPLPARLTLNGSFVTASLNIPAGSTVALGHSPASSYSLTVNALSIDPSGTLDVGNNVVKIDYGTSASPDTWVRGWIVAGRSGGTWTGPGITSADAAANPDYLGVGWMDQPSTQVETIRGTLLGDANLDGRVDVVDLGAVATHFGQQTGAAWSAGDFTTDGSVDVVDLGLLATNFGKSEVGSGAAALPASALADAALSSAPRRRIMVARAR